MSDAAMGKHDDSAKAEWLQRVLGVSITTSDPDIAPALSLVQLQRARLTWETTRATVKQYLRTLDLEVLKFFEERPEFTTAQEAVQRFDEVLSELDEDLIDTLDEWLNELDPARRVEIQADARACIEDYEDFVRGSDLVAGIDANPFTKVDIRETVLRSAAQLHAALG